MARSLSSVKAFFEGLDSGAAERRREEELAAKRRLEDQNFLFKTAAEQRAVEDQAQRGEIFALGKTSRQLAADQAAATAKQFGLNTPLIERVAEQARITAINTADNFDTNLPDLTKNAATKAAQAVAAQALNLAQTDEQLKQLQANPYLFNQGARTNDAAIVAAGVETADSIITRRGLVLPEALKTAGEVTKMQWLENSGKFLNKTQAEITATQKATELAAAKSADQIAAIEARYAAAGANQAASAAAKAVEADKKRAVEYPATAAPAAATTAPAARPVVPGLSATLLPAARPVVPGLSATLPPAALPVPAMPTAPAKAAPAPAAATAVPTAQPAPTSKEALQTEADKLASELAELESALPRTGRQLLVWNASNGKVVYDAKKARLRALNDQIYRPSFIK